MKVYEDSRDGIRTNSGAVGLRDGGEECSDEGLICAEGRGDRDEDTGRGRDSGRDNEGPNVDGDGVPGPETGEFISMV